MNTNPYRFGQYVCCLFVLFLANTNLFGQKAPNKLEQMRQAYERSINEHKFNNRPNMTRAQLKAIPKATRPDLAWEQDFMMTKDPNLGYIPIERRINAIERVNTMLKNRISSNLRTEAGIANVKWNERGPNNVGGSTRAMMFDPNDPTNKKVWAGVTGGGLWYTNDVTIPKPTWNKVDDFWDNLSVSWVTSAPNKTDFYAATGDGFMGGSSVPGAGIWKSSNSGANWTRLESTKNPDFTFVLKVVVTGAAGQGVVLAGTRTGMFRSADGGATWTKVIAANEEPYNSGSIADIEVASNGDIYASLGVIFNEGKIAKSTDNGLTWKLLSALPAQSPQRLQIAVSPTNPNLLYVAAQGSGTNTLLPNGGVFRTIDGGATWQTLATPINGDGEGKDGASQAWIHLTLAIDPNNDQHVILGGLDLFRTTNGGTNWTQISKWSNNGKLSELTCSIVHADHTNTLFFPANTPDSSNKVLFGNDGGVYYTDKLSVAATQDVIKERNNGYNVTQFYAGAINPTANSSNFLGGAQDNGTQLFRQAGIGSSVEASGGDGAYCFIDQDEPLIQITSYTNNNYYLSTDGINFPGITTNSDGSFINPADYDSRENILYSTRDANSIQRITNIGRPNARVVSPVQLAIGTKATHFSVSPYAAAGTSTVFIGTAGGRIFKVSDAHATPTLADITGDMPQKGSISCIAIGASEDELLMTLSNYGVKSVWISKNGGTNWISKDEAAHGLSDIPVRWALFNPKNRNQVLLATEIGVWSTDNINDANPGWQPTSTDMANVRVNMLKYRASDGVVLAATYGRGLYTTNVFASPLADLEAQYITWFANKPLNFYDRSISATSWAWNFGGGGATNATTQNPTATYTTAGTYTVSLIINGNANLTKSISVTILPEPTIPYSNNFDTNGGGFIPKILSGKGEWQWGRTTANKTNMKETALGGTGNSWITNLNADHNTNTQYTLESPPFSTVMLPTGDYFLSFDYIALVGDGAGFNMEYSTNSGSTWTILGSVGDANATNWYTTASIPGIEGAAGWVQKSASTIFKPSYKISAIAALMGQADVRFRFVFGAKANDWDGVQIDNFTITAPPTTAPTVTTYLPAVGATAVARNANLVLTFDKTVQKGTGNITINQPAGGTQKEVINVSSANVVVDGNTVTITPSDVLNIGATAEVIVDAGAFKDIITTPNNFVGIAASAWTFTISADANTQPTLNTIANSGILKEDAGEQTVNLNGITSGDGTSQAMSFTSATSDNQDMLPNANISVTYTNPANTAVLKYTPAKNKNGVATITVIFTDAGGLVIQRTFTVNVTKTNDPPTFTVPASAPPVEQGTTTSQTVGGFATGIDDGDPDEEQELNFIVNVSIDGLLVGDEIDIFDEIDIDTETGNLIYKLLPEVKGEISVNVQLFDDGEGEDPSRGTEAGGSDNSSAKQTFKLSIVPAGTLNPNNPNNPNDPNNPNNPTKPITVLGLNDEDSKHISLYPNPSKGVFALKYEGLPTANFLSITIMNVTGQVVYQGQRGNFTGTYEGEIDLSDVANGVYIVNIASDKKLYRKRLVVAK